VHSKKTRQDKHKVMMIVAPREACEEKVCVCMCEVEWWKKKSMVKTLSCTRHLVFFVPWPGLLAPACDPPSAPMIAQA